MNSYGRPLIEAACHAYLYAESIEQRLRQWFFRAYNLSALVGAEKSEEVEMKASEEFPEGSLHIYRGEVLRVVGYDHANSAVTIMFRNGMRQTHPASWLREHMRPFAINTGDVWRGQPPNPQVGVVLNVNVEAESAYLAFGDNMRAWRSFSWIGANLTLEGGVDHHAKPRPYVPPLTGYAEAHAEMLGVTPAQYRAARPEATFGRKARRALFARRVQALVEQPDRVEPPPSAPVDLTGAGGVPWGGRGVGPDLPYDPEEP
jgi:hypothetical protein